MKYEELKIDVISINAEDIVCTSGAPQDLNYGNNGVGVDVGNQLFSNIPNVE